MDHGPKYYIIESESLPEIYVKVAEAKRLMATGAAETVNDAAKMCGISRSAFYKYRDSVHPFRQLNANRMVTFQFVLRDEPGALSNILAIFADQKANLMTVNSITPSNGCAIVTVSAETTEMTISVEDMLHEFLMSRDVIKAEILAAG